MNVAVESVGAGAPSARVSAASRTMLIQVAFTLVGGLTVAGAYLDGWAHNHLESTLETFFTPWHAVLYGGYGLTALLVVGIMAQGRAQGRMGLRALPVGYGSAALGALIFGVSGVLDLLWHTLFGIEANVEALLSPTHLGLATGMILVVASPLRAAWAVPGRTLPSNLWGWTAVLGVALVLAGIQFMLQFANPFNDVWPVFSNANGEADWWAINQGIDSTLIQTAILMGALLLLIRRWDSLPIGTVTLLVLIPAIGLGFQHDQHQTALVALGGGIVGDVLLWRLRPSSSNLRGVRFFAFLAPAALYLEYMVVAQASYGIVWSIHLWAGLIVMAGFTGLLASVIALPPNQPDSVGVAA